VNIFKPLGMTDAYFNGDPVRTVPDHASGYSPQRNGWRLVPESSGYAGNGGMMSSVRDLLLWANNFADARVGTPALLAGMQTATVLTGGQTTQSADGIRHWSVSGCADVPARREVISEPHRTRSIPIRSSPSRCCATWIRSSWVGWQRSTSTS
jgi:CubicO group peptidase (beta-lactamase class C family)